MQGKDGYKPLQSLKKFVVVGGCGYVGRWLALELAFHCPRAVVVAFDVSQPSGFPFASLFDDLEFDIRRRGAGLRAASRRVRIFQGSVLSARDLDAALESCDVVFNTAAYGMASTNGVSVERCHAVNVGGCAALLAACERRGVGGVVHVSSTVAVFDGSPIINGTGELPLVTRAHHGNHYGHTKALSEGVLRRAPAGIRVVIVRPNGIFGPNDNTHFPRLKRLLRDGLFNLKVGDGKSLVDWIFVDNLTHALLLSAAVATASAHGGGGSARITVHVSDEDPREMNHLFCSFAEGLGYTPPSIRIPTAFLAQIATLMVTASRLCFGAFAPLLTPCEALKAGTHMVFSTADARAALRWQPVLSYDFGVKLTLEYEHRKLLRCSPPPLEVPPLMWWLLIVGGMWLCYAGDAAAAAFAVGGDCGLMSALLCRVVVFGSQSAASVNLSLSFVFWSAVISHVVEALVAVRVMRRMKAASHSSLLRDGTVHQHFFDWHFGLMCAYFLQTIILGYPSLKILIRYSRLQQIMMKSGVFERHARGEALM